MTLSAISDKGTPVDWWFLYKIPGHSTASDGSAPTGKEYVYYDPESGMEKLVLSADHVSDGNDGAVANTLNQIFKNIDDPDTGWFFYNDEDPLTGQTSMTRGHTKGVLCFNKSSAFWLIHSAPKLVGDTKNDKYEYPLNAMDFAQTFLCITLKDANEAKSIAEQMYVAQQPQVCWASPVPSWLDPSDKRALLLNNKITSDTAPYAAYIIFHSAAGMAFKSIAKNSHWNTPGDDDFYNDLVGPTLTESIEVETWGHTTAVPGRLQVDKVHTVLAMKSVDLSPLGINPSYEWGEGDDHAKLCVSDNGEKNHFVCVGDINFTKSQELRCGGTVAFIHDPLWSSIIGILKDTVVRKSTNQKAKPRVTHSVTRKPRA